MPWPVLSPYGDDIIPSEYALDASIEGDGQNWIFRGEINHENETIRDMVSKGRFTHGVHIECAETMYRSWKPVGEGKFNIEIPYGSLRGRVELSAACVTTEDVHGYKNSDQHSDYKGASFNVAAGCVVAYATTCVCHAYLDADPIRKISSILNISKDSDRQSGPVEIQLGGQRINARIGEEDYKKYVSARANDNITGIIASGIVFPVILQVIYYLRGMGDDELDVMRSDHRWCRSLLAKMESEDIELEDKDHLKLFEKIQEMLRMPVRRGISDILKQLENRSS